MQMILAAVAIINARDDENFKPLDYALIHRRWSTANILHLREAKYSNNERVHRVIGELREALSRRGKDFRFDFRTSVCCLWPPGLVQQGESRWIPSEDHHLSLYFAFKVTAQFTVVGRSNLNVILVD